MRSPVPRAGAQYLHQHRKLLNARYGLAGDFLISSRKGVVHPFSEVNPMFHRIRKYVFSLYERRLLRNWSYTFAFAIFVPVGCRFAILAWKFGGDFDRVMTVVAGIAVGITAAVTLLRIWVVPPRKTMLPVPEGLHAAMQEMKPDGSEIIAALKAYSARNRQIAMGARALGLPRYH